MTMVDFVLSPYEDFCPGIQRAIGTCDWSFGETGLGRPQPMKQWTNILKVDLTSPGIQLLTSAREQLGLYTVRQFLDAQFPNVSGIAIASNGNYFDMASRSTIYGLAVSNGAVVNLPAPGDDPPCPVALIFASAAGTPPFAGSIRIVDPGDPVPANTWAAVSGAEMLLAKGDIVAVDADPPYAARTGAGVSEDGTTLYLVTVDGAEKSGEAYGASLTDIATWLFFAGAYDAVNLDGGGSTTLARIGLGQPALLMNVPYDDDITPGTERTVGNCFAIVSSGLG